MTLNNGKHLNFDKRIVIANGVGKKLKLKEIAELVGTDPTTISKELKRNRKKYNDLTKPCDKLSRFPYVCNACKNKYTVCGYAKYEYYAKSAQTKADNKLVANRCGISLSEKDLKRLDKAVKKGIEDKKSIYDIVTSLEDIDISVSTVYRYINKKYLTTSRMDLPYAVTYKKRKKANKKYDYPENTKFSRNNRTYIDFLAYKNSHPGLFHTQMDFLGAIKASSTNILTLSIPELHFVLLYKVKKYSYKDVMMVFNELEDKLGINDFKKVFPYILTDRDPLFSNFQALEFSYNTGEERTHVFYCDAFCSAQKGNVENMNKQLRIYFPKKASIDNYSKEDIKMINMRLNQRRLPSLSGSSPEEAFIKVYGLETYNKLFK